MKIWLAEFIGTFALVFAGIGSIAAGNEGLAVALTFGLTVAVMISAVGGISFAHFMAGIICHDLFLEIKTLSGTAFLESYRCQPL